jgi:hypothetical protein
MSESGDDFGDLDDEDLAAIGRVAIAFGHIEFLTREILHRLVDDPPAEGLSVTRQVDYIADLAEDLLDEDEELVAAVRRWSAEVKTAATTRNAILHGSWSRDPAEDQDNMHVMGFRRGQDSTRTYTLTELRTAAHRLSTLVHTTLDLHDDVADYFVFRHAREVRGWEV